MDDSKGAGATHDSVRNAAAEAWLLDRHDYDWYIGNATTDEWREAYRAVDAVLGSGGAQ